MRTFFAHPPRRWILVCAAIASAVVAVGVAITPTTSVAAGTVAWTSYHGGGVESGVANGIRAVTTSSRAWTSPALNGLIYGQPVVDGTEVLVATENDEVYALASTNGRVLWSRRVANPVPSSALACGNISPDVGITGTPVVDSARHEVFVVADEWRAGRAQHRLLGLNTRTGAIELSEIVDPAGSDPSALLQRTGLTLVSGRVVFGFGGNYGDCGTYRGRVVAVNESGGRPFVYTVDSGSGQSMGAVWMGGAAPVVDGHGRVWVSVGNGSVTTSQGPYDHSDAILELSPAMRLIQYFAPTTWAQDNAADADLSMAPALMGSGLVVASGKSRVAYLLRGQHLGGVGGELASQASVCANDVDGGAVVRGSTVILPCLAGPVAVRVSSSPPAVSVLWSATSGGGPPVEFANRVWSIGSNGTLYGLDPSSGAVLQHAAVGTTPNHFATIGVGDGLLLVPSATRVVAFRAHPVS